MGVRGSGARRAAAVVATIVMAVVALFDAALGSPAGASVQGVTLDARVDDKPVGDSTEVRPIRLSPKKSALLVVEVTNHSSRPIDIRIVRLEGKVVGLTFFAYDTAVALTVAPGATGSRRFPLDLGGLDGQATGLIPGSVKLLDPDRHVVAEETGVVDVRGSLFSVYGLFGIGVAILTIVSFFGALIGLARHRLPPNRWRRALRFMTPGIGLGLLINFTLSATRVFVPGVGRWLTIMVVSGAVFFGLGYVTPTPVLEEEEEEEEEALALPASPVAAELEAPPVQAEIEPSPTQPQLAAPEEAPALQPVDESRELPPVEDVPAGSLLADVPPLAEAPAASEAPSLADEAPAAPPTVTVPADEAPAAPPTVTVPSADEPAAPPTVTVPSADESAAPPTVIVPSADESAAPPTVGVVPPEEPATVPTVDAVAADERPPRLPIVVPCHLPAASTAEPWPQSAPQTVVVPTEEQ